jgi:hypothetical protein
MQPTRTRQFSHTPERSLTELEAVIQRGKDTFIEVGLALIEVRDRELYAEAGFSTFQAYIQTRLGITRQHGYNLMSAAEAATHVKSICHGESPSLTQAIELGKLTNEQQREVAATTDFSTVSVRHLKERIEPLKVAVTVTPKPERVTRYTVSHEHTPQRLSAGQQRRRKAVKDLERTLRSLLRKYGDRSIASVSVDTDPDDGEKLIKGIELRREGARA